MNCSLRAAGWLLLSESRRQAGKCHELMRANYDEKVNKITSIPVFGFPPRLVAIILLLLSFASVFFFFSSTCSFSVSVFR